jgi:hypothetical protein
VKGYETTISNTTVLSRGYQRILPSTFLRGQASLFSQGYPETWRGQIHQRLKPHLKPGQNFISTHSPLPRPKGTIRRGTAVDPDRRIAHWRSESQSELSESGCRFFTHILLELNGRYRLSHYGTQTTGEMSRSETSERSRKHVQSRFDRFP